MTMKYYRYYFNSITQVRAISFLLKVKKNKNNSLDAGALHYYRQTILVFHVSR